MTDAALHPALEHLAGLVGTWRGTGTGVYPTIDSFDYAEEAVFDHVGKPFLTYTQRTKDPVTGAPLHAESGYVRPGTNGVSEWVISQPTGILEMLTAPDADAPLDFTSTEVLLSPTAKPVVDVLRRYVLDGDTLSYEVHMAAMGEPLQLHLTAALSRVG